MFTQGLILKEVFYGWRGKGGEDGSQCMGTEVWKQVTLSMAAKGDRSFWHEGEPLL